MLKRKHRTKKGQKKEGMESKKEKMIINRVDNSSNFLLSLFVVSSGFFSSFHYHRFCFSFPVFTSPCC